MQRFSLKPTPPFRLDLTAWVLRRRPDNDVDRWEDGKYRRVLVAGSAPIEVTVEQTGTPERPGITVAWTENAHGEDVRAFVLSAVERLLGVHADLAEFYRIAAREPVLGLLARRFRGVKPPRFPSLFETLSNAIACQQLSLTVGIRMLNRLAAACGPGLRCDDGATHFAFPRPEDVASANPETLRKLGWSRQKTRALLELAGGIVEGRLDLERLTEEDDAFAAARLVELRGIGRWSAEYALLRGLGRLHVFPGDDVGARNRIERTLRLRKRLDYEGVRRVAARWRPYAGLVYFHFLLDGLAAAGANLNGGRVTS